MKTEITIKTQRLEGFLQALVSLNALEISTPLLVLDVAENINIARDQVERVNAEVQEIAADVSSRAVLVAPGAAPEAPQAEFNRRRAAVLARDTKFEVHTLPVELLLNGEKKATPGAIAELMPLLRNLDEIRKATLM